METVSRVVPEYRYRVALALLSRLKGMETRYAYDLGPRQQGFNFGSAFPFEGNGNVVGVGTPFLALQILAMCVPV